MERRKFVRVNTLAEVRYRLKGQPVAQTRLAESWDISEGGIRLSLSEPLAAGQEILFTIHPQNTEEEQRPEISGVVAWQGGDVNLRDRSGNTSSAGIAFSMTDGVVRNRIHRWMEELTTAPTWKKVALQVQLQQIDKRFSPPQIKDSEFDSFAKKALAIIKDSNDDIRSQVEGFFNKDIRQYQEELSALVHKMTNGKIESEEIEKRLTILTNNLLLKGNALEGRVDNVGMKKIKQLFRELTGCWFYQSPIMKMAYEKPRGYPGDYELFEIIYNGKPLAKESTIGFYFDKYFLNNTYTQAVRTRKNRMKNILQDLIESNNSSCLRLLNVACGPCREVRELLSDPFLVSKATLCFTGLDNDEGSLKFSKFALDKLPPNITVRFLNENVLSLFKNSKYYDIIGKQDVVYILGLTEYLPDRIFKKLVGFLSQLLDDKGMLVITYKDKDIPFPSLPPDWLCDWAFIKRSRDDLISATKGLGLEKYSLRIEKEGTGTIFFLILTKA